ncbi:MAG: AbrB/MazE/SpoVT family DNA-binding domain-containing protein [Anaerolineae bacterium]|nr:AbrB/MazE/SpoVT family DNA-binding domain-containing protein [Anaerolineae bacterium]
MRMARVRLDTEGRITLPDEVLTALTLLPGDDLYFVIHGSHVILTTAPEDYAPYLIKADRQASQFPDRLSLPEDWLGWEEWGEWEEWEEETRQ